MLPEYINNSNMILCGVCIFCVWVCVCATCVLSTLAKLTYPLAHQNEFTTYITDVNMDVYVYVCVC